MARLFRKHSFTVGAAPGALPTPETHVPARLVTINFSKDALERKELHYSDDWAPVNLAEHVTWVHVEGAADVKAITSIGAAFKLHPLVLEAVATLGQRPREEDYDDYLFVALRALGKGEDGALRGEQVSVVVGPDWLLSFAENRSPLLEKLWEQLSIETSRVRGSGADYLAYRIIDIVIDQYFVPLEEIGDGLDQIDDALMKGTDVLADLYQTKRRLMVMRRTIWPMRDLLLRVERLDSQLIRDDTRIFLRDARDHIVQVADTVGLYQEMASAMLDVHLSLQGNRMNEVMKVLTIIATVFMPLGFLAGLYGMNFENMPELKLAWAYPALLLLMTAVAGSMLLFFRRKSWL